MFILIDNQQRHWRFGFRADDSFNLPAPFDLLLKDVGRIISGHVAYTLLRHENTGAHYVRRNDNNAMARVFPVRSNT